MPESERGGMSPAELEPVNKLNARWNIREFVQGQRREFKYNRLESTYAQVLPDEIEQMAEEFPELELTPFQKRLLWDSLGTIQKRVFENAIKERDSRHEIDQDENMAMATHVQSTLLQVYGFLHSLEADRS